MIFDSKVAYEIGHFYSTDITFGGIAMNFGLGVQNNTAYFSQ